MHVPEVMVIGFQDVAIQKHLEHSRIFGIDSDRLVVQNLDRLPLEQDMESTPAPIVTLLRADAESVFRDLESIRQHWHYASVIVCGERAAMPIIHQLLAKGATDFLEWPLNTEDCALRIAARVGAYHCRSRESTRQLGALTLNMMQRTVSNSRDTAFLTPIETKIVTVLADSLGRVIERSAMKQICWGDMSITDNALNRKIYEVRRTLRRLSEEINIRTIYGLGFELEVADRSERS